MRDPDPDELMLTLRYDVEQLETAHALICSAASGRRRLALLLLDNLSELLTYRLCREAATRDRAFSRVVPPRADHKRWEKALTHYTERIKLCHQLLIVASTIDATVLRIAHRYRNISYHGDAHNDAAIRVLTPLLFSSVTTLFCRFHTNVGVGGLPEEEVSWLTTYGIASEYIDIGEAAAAVVTRLSVGIETQPVAAVQEALRADLERRVQALRHRAASDFPTATEDDIDLGIRRCEFERVHAADIDGLWRPLRLMNYRIAEGKGDEVERDEYTQVETQANEGVETLLASFRSKTSWRSLTRLNKDAIALTLCDGLEELLVRYAEIDSQVSRLERFGGEALDRWDARAAFLSDLERGK